MLGVTLSYTIVSVFLGNIVCFLAATSLSWPSPEIKQLNSTMHFGKYVTDEESSWIASLGALGAIFGTPVFSLTADKFGRRFTVAFLGFPYATAYLIFAFARKIELFYFARFFCGMGVSSCFTVIPIYIAELADSSNRAALATSMIIFVSSGSLLVYVLAPYMSIMAFNLILATIAISFSVSFFLIASETPYYLIKKGDKEGATKCLQNLRGNKKDVSKEIEEIEINVAEASKASIKDIFSSKGLIKAFVIAIILGMIQQLCGMNAILSYSTQIFQDTGSSLDADISTIIIGVTQFLTSFSNSILTTRYRNRILYMLSAFGCSLVQIPLGIFFFLKQDGVDVCSYSFVPVVCLVSFIICYNFGMAALGQAIIGELFPSNVKFIVSALINSINGISGFLATKYFVDFSVAVGKGPAFWAFSSVCLLAVAFCKFYVIETSGKTLQQIQDELND